MAGLLRVDITHPGRRILDPVFRQNGARQEALHYTEMARQCLIKPTPVNRQRALAYGEHADYLIGLDDITSGFRNYSSVTQLQSEYGPLVQNDTVFPHLRNYMYHLTLSGDQDAIDFYHTQFRRTPLIHRERVLSDLFFLAILNGSETAKNVIESTGISFDNFKSPYADLDLLREVKDPQLPYDADQFVLALHAGGTYRNHDILRYAKASQILLKWLGVNLEPEDNEYVSHFFRQNDSIVNNPRSLSFNIARTQHGVFKEPLQTLANSIPQLMEFLDTVQTERRLAFFYGHDLIQYSSPFLKDTLDELSVHFGIVPEQST